MCVCFTTWLTADESNLHLHSISNDKVYTCIGMGLTHHVFTFVQTYEFHRISSTYCNYNNNLYIYTHTTRYLNMYIHMHIYIIFSNRWTPVLLLHLLQAQSVMIIPRLNWVLMTSIQWPSNLHGARASILQILATCFSQRKTHRVRPTKNMGSGASYSPLGRWGGY